MKTINQLLAVSALVFGAQAAQAHITEDATHTHEGSQMRSTIQAMSPTDRMNFRGAMQTSLEGMTTEERQVFRDNMRSEQGMGQGQGNQHQYGAGSDGSGQGNRHMYGGGQQGAGAGNGYGRGYGKR